MKKAFKFSKSNLMALVKKGKPVTVKDKQEIGLRFKVGKLRASFYYEKRIYGRKGSPVTFTLGSFPAFSLEEARQEARRLATLCERGIDPRIQDNPSANMKLTYEAALCMFLGAKKEIRKKTRTRYEQLATGVPQSWYQLDIREITPSMIEAHFHGLRNEFRDSCWTFLKVIENIWNTCASQFRNHKGERILGESPIAEVRAMLKHQKIQPDDPKRPVITRANLGRFLVTVEEMIREAPRRVPKMYYEIVLVTLFTGFRHSEARTLKWEMLDLEQGVIFLSGDGTKNGHDHWVPLSSYLWDLFKKIKAERGEESAYIFPQVSNPNKPMERYHRLNTGLCKRLGFHFAMHACRRTFASIADDVGLGYLKVKRMLNHAYKGGVTAGYISKDFNPGKDREAFQQVCDYILDCRAEHLGKREPLSDGMKALTKLQQLAKELGVDLETAIKMLTSAA